MKNILVKLAIKYLQYYAKKEYGYKLKTKTKLAWEYELQRIVVKDVN